MMSSGPAVGRFGLFITELVVKVGSRGGTAPHLSSEEHKELLSLIHI